MKDLIINDKIYAKYEIEGYHLYLKIIIPIIKGKRNEEKCENFIVNLIQFVENKKFYCVSYLNL